MATDSGLSGGIWQGGAASALTGDDPIRSSPGLHCMKKLALSLAVVAASSAYVWNQWGGDPNGALLGLSPANAESSLDSEASPDPQPTGGIAAPALPPAAADATPSIEAAPAAKAEPATRAEPAAVILPAPFVIDHPAPPAPPITADATPVPVAPTSNLPTPSVIVAAAAPEDVQPVAVPAPQRAPAPTIAAVTPDQMPPRPRPRPHLVAEAVPLATNVSMTVAARGGYADGTFTGPAVDAYYGMVQIQAIVRSGKLAGIKVLQYPSDRRTSVAINRQALPMLRDEAVTAQSAEVDLVSGATLTSQAFIRSLRGALKQATA